MKRILLFISCLLLGRSVFADILPKPSVANAVYDYADVLTVDQYNDLNSELIDFSDTTSTRIVVLTVTDLDGMTSAEYAYEIGESWGVGGKDDNGVVLLLKVRTEDSGGDVAISVGYGLEGVIPDAACHWIIQDQMIPFFSEEMYFEGICAGVSVLKDLAYGEYSYMEIMDGDETAEDEVEVFFVFIVMVIILFIILKRIYRGGGNSGGMGGFGSGFGSGFGGSGGFGGSSDGGFSGGFSGGFGGGHFGGGGASGKF